MKLAMTRRGRQYRATAWCP